MEAKLLYSALMLWKSRPAMISTFPGHCRTNQVTFPVRDKPSACLSNKAHTLVRNPPRGPETRCDGCWGLLKDLRLDFLTCVPCNLDVCLDCAKVRFPNV